MVEWIKHQQAEAEEGKNPQGLRNTLFGEWGFRTTLLCLTKEEQDIVMGFIDQIQQLMNDESSSVNIRDWVAILPILKKGNLEPLDRFARDFILRELEKKRSQMIAQKENQMYQRGENLQGKTWDVPEDLQALRTRVKLLEQIATKTADTAELLKNTPTERRLKEVSDLLGVSEEELRKGPSA